MREMEGVKPGRRVGLLKFWDISVKIKGIGGIRNSKWNLVIVCQLKRSSLVVQRCPTFLNMREREREGVERGRRVGLLNVFGYLCEEKIDCGK